MSEWPPKVKRLRPDQIMDLAEKNKARRLNGLRELRLVVRSCLACGSLFESLGQRTCGCVRDD